MTDLNGETRAELREEWIRAVEHLQNLHRLQSEMRTITQRSGASWSTVNGLDEIIAKEASRANELRYLIEGALRRHSAESE